MRKRFRVCKRVIFPKRRQHGTYSQLNRNFRIADKPAVNRIGQHKSVYGYLCGETSYKAPTSVPE